MIERIKNLKKALLLERDAELQRYTSLIQEQSIKERIKAGVTLYPVGFTGEGYNSYEELVLSFDINENQDPFQFSSNGKVHLFNGNNTEKIEGIVASLKNNTLTVQISDNDLPDWIKSGKLGLNAIPDTRTTDVQLRTLERIEKGELKIAEHFYKIPTQQQFTENQLSFEGFNNSQNKAISGLTSANMFQIVHGPPGTGKTKSIVKAILHLASQGKRIMVSAPSNAAVDHITAELSKQNKAIVRLGNSFKITEAVQPFTLKSQINNSTLMDVVKRLKKDAEGIRKKAFKYKRNFDKTAYQERKQLRNELREIRKDIRKIEQEIGISCINNAQIITGTFIGLQDKKLDKISFDAVFIDEAGQALEPAIWSIAHHSELLFLAGDPLQLPPTLFSNDAKKLGLSVSLIEKGIEVGIPTHLLDTQYRMNDQIMQFSNHYFYEGLLNSANTVANAVVKNDEYTPVEFIDTAGCGYEENKDENGGIYNSGEITIIEKRLENLKTSPCSIGIISPYRKQVNLLKEALQEFDHKVQTIDSFQGQERDIIMVSLVRSNDQAVIGFLKDYRRMNVAMTRAKLKLIIIGDSATIGNDSFYQSLLAYIEKNGAYRSGWEFMD